MEEKDKEITLRLLSVFYAKAANLENFDDPSIMYELETVISTFKLSAYCKRLLYNRILETVEIIRNPPQQGTK